MRGALLRAPSQQSMPNKYNPDIHHRQSIRLKDYDYTQAGAYFITICTKDRECLFGDISDNNLHYNDYGQIAYEFWLKIREHFSNSELDGFIVMPNHIHGIIMINTRRGEVSSPIGVSSPELNAITSIQKGGETPPLHKHALGQFIAFYKYQTTKQINQIRNTSGMSVWQRNYYEHIIRNENELDKIRQYIIDNPFKWNIDENNPVNMPKRNSSCPTT